MSLVFFLFRLKHSQNIVFYNWKGKLCEGTSRACFKFDHTSVHSAKWWIWIFFFFFIMRSDIFLAMFATSSDILSDLENSLL